jgi:hypothetical protein
MPVQLLTLDCGNGKVLKIPVDFLIRQNWYKIGPGKMAYAYPPVTYWGTFQTPPDLYLVGFGILVEKKIEIYFEGQRFIDRVTFDLITEHELPWWPPPEIPGCRAIDDAYTSVIGRKVRFNSEGGIISN